MMKCFYVVTILVVGWRGGELSIIYKKKKKRFFVSYITTFNSHLSEERIYLRATWRVPDKYITHFEN